MDSVLYKKYLSGVVDVRCDDEVAGTVISFTDEAGKVKQVTLQGGFNKIELDAGHTYTARNVTKDEEMDTFELANGEYHALYVNTYEPYHIYGAMWDGTASTLFSRTDDSSEFENPIPYVAGMSAGQYSSPFDDIYPWSEIKRVEDPQAGSLVEIPKFWFKWIFPEGGGLGIKILDTDPKRCGLQNDGWHTSPMHMDRHDGKSERDVAYIGRYKCASDYKSKTGQSTVSSLKLSQYRSGITALGSGIYQYDYEAFITLTMLYLVEFANWDSQAVIGKGISNETTQQIKSNYRTGTTDSMPYHTGTVRNSKNTIGSGIQYRYIEDLWSCGLETIDGFWTDGDVYIGINPQQYSSDTNNKTKVSDKFRLLTGGEKYAIGSWSNPMDYTNDEDFAWAIFPASKASSGYCPDQVQYNPSGTGESCCLQMGGNNKGSSGDGSSQYGLFFHYWVLTTSLHTARLQKLP